MERETLEIESLDRGKKTLSFHGKVIGKDILVDIRMFFVIYVGCA